MIWLKRLYWSIKVGLFPHLDRRRKKRAQSMRHADDMLATAIIDFTKAIEGKNEIR